MKTNIHFLSYLAEFFLECGIVYPVVEKIKINLLYSITFCENRAVFEKKKKILYSRTGQTKI
jgi:hypothetical protein